MIEKGCICLNSLETERQLTNSYNKTDGERDEETKREIRETKNVDMTDFSTEWNAVDQKKEENDKQGHYTIVQQS